MKGNKVWMLSFNSILIWICKNSNIKFDIIFLDPPYKLNLINDCLNKIYDYNLLNSNGIIVCEFENEDIVTEDFELIKEKK